MTVRCIDIETTGTDPEKDAIIEIASVDLRPDSTITNQQAALVAPDIPVPAVASAVHHLIGADLVAAPRIEQVIERFKGADAYIAHNCAFERSFLDRHFGDPIWVCTYKCALRLWPDLPSHSNQALRYHFGLVNPFGIDRATLAPHRALADAIVTAAVFFEMARHAKWPDLVRWSYEPALLTYLRFGMHRGERFDAVPEDYLRWIAEGNHDLTETCGSLLVIGLAGGHPQSRPEGRLEQRPVYKGAFTTIHQRTPRAGHAHTTHCACARETMPALVGLAALRHPVAFASAAIFAEPPQEAPVAAIDHALRLTPSLRSGLLRLGRFRHGSEAFQLRHLNSG